MQQDHVTFVLFELTPIQELNDELYEAMMDNDDLEVLTAINKIQSRLSKLKRIYKDKCE